jgi:hypothetical protein
LILINHLRPLQKDIVSLSLGIRSLSKGKVILIVKNVISMSREDRSRKLKDRKNKNQRVIKCFLKTLIIKENKDEIVNSIKKRVASYSQRQVIASISLNLMIKELFQNVVLENIKNVDIPNILDTTFIRQLLLGTDESIKPSPHIIDFYQHHSELLKQLNKSSRYIGDRNIYSSGAIKFSTNVYNHFWTTFKNRMYRFINSLDKEKRIAVLFYLMNWDINQEKKDIINSLPEKTRYYLKIQKDILGDQKIDESWLKDKININKLIKYNIFISRFIDKKNFNIIPMSTIRCHYIAIDTSTLYGIFKELHYVNSNFPTFNTLKQDHWKSFINVEKIQCQHNEFTYMIETDGVAVSVHFERPKKYNNKDNVISSTEVEYWGCDPGRTNIYFMTKKNEDGSYKSLKLSRRQYYKESGILKARERTNRWQNKDHIQNFNLSIFSSKGHLVETFQQFVNNILTHWDDLWKEYSTDKWTQQKMRLYGGKKRVFSKFFNKIISPNKKTVIGYGSAKFNPTAKNEVAVPTSSGFKECSYRFKTVPVDEFRTTKIYHQDSETVLKEVQIYKSNKKVRGLLWYGSTTCSVNKFVNRDLNASINILNCFLNPVRPKMLTRSEGNEKIKVEVGKKIYR